MDVGTDQCFKLLCAGYRNHSVIFIKFYKLHVTMFIYVTPSTNCAFQNFINLFKTPCRNWWIQVLGRLSGTWGDIGTTIEWNEEWNVFWRELFFVWNVNVLQFFWGRVRAIHAAVRCGEEYSTSFGRPAPRRCSVFMYIDERPDKRDDCSYCGKKVEWTTLRTAMVLARNKQIRRMWMEHSDRIVRTDKGNGVLDNFL